MDRSLHGTCAECGGDFINGKGLFCFNCHFWLEKIALQKRNPSKFIVADGSMFFIAPENVPPGTVRGYSGAKALIEWPHSGDRVTTTNLWSNGRVPDRFRDRLPDTAVLTWL